MPPSSTTLKFSALRQNSSTGAAPFKTTFLISFDSSTCTFLAGGGESDFLFLELDFLGAALAGLGDGLFALTSFLPFAAAFTTFASAFFAAAFAAGLTG